ncbi:MFS transporter [Micromonospora gifhornensis]|uniref:MFS transporter n=1 Tax=Micromonospora gifhornensis TaxID=84594 RepID=A0ABQ4I8G6_9ACTN|nr:MFS transporter [Micromonospora gifhornensis]GIJ14176.1 MFS transporter [Micromonospora gifhornensis]
MASVLAALAPAFWVLLVARVMQGVASAVYLAGYLPIVAAAVRPQHRGRALSYISTIMMLGSVVIAPLGGFVADGFGWRAVFLFKAPLLVPVVIAGWRTIPTDRAHRVPMPGRGLAVEALLLGGAVVLALLSVEYVQTGWWWSLVLGAVAVVLTVAWSRLSSSRPVLALLRRRAFGLPALALMLMASLLGLVVFSLPYFVAEVLDDGPSVLGVAMLFFTAAASLVAPLAGLLADRYQPLPVAAAGVAMTVAGLLSMLTLGPAANVVDLSWRMLLIGAGMALFNSPTVTLLLAAAPEGRAGTAGGVSNLVRTLGTTIGPAATALMWSLGGGIGGFRTGVVMLTAFAVAGLVALVATGRHAL